VSGERGHEAVLVYVLTNGGRPILIDTGSHLHRAEIMREIDQVLEGRPPEVVFLTHTELPHTGNVRAIMAKWPGVMPVAPNLISAYIELAPVVELEKMVLAPVGRTASFAGRELKFLHGVLKDQPGTQWIYDPKEKVLFTADAFGYFHGPGECSLLGTEREGGVSLQMFSEYNSAQFKFLKWVIPGRLWSSLDKVFEHDVEIIAPTHGNPIVGEVGIHFERLKESVAVIRSEAEARKRGTRAGLG
jgi:flavorubredoxin